MKLNNAEQWEFESNKYQIVASLREGVHIIRISDAPEGFEQKDGEEMSQEDFKSYGQRVQRIYHHNTKKDSWYTHQDLSPEGIARIREIPRDNVKQYSICGLTSRVTPARGGGPMGMGNLLARESEDPFRYNLQSRGAYESFVHTTHWKIRPVSLDDMVEYAREKIMQVERSGA